jgi:cbb3-type cytochrome oxidase subunit 1
MPTSSPCRLLVACPVIGIHHYLYSPIADWAETIAIATSMPLIIPVDGAGELFSK